MLKALRYPGSQKLGSLFDLLTAPEHDPRLMRLRPVYEHHKLGKGDLWANIHSKVRNLLEALQSAELTFAPRLNSTSETSSIRPSTLFVSAGLRRTRSTRTPKMTRTMRAPNMSTSRSPRTGQSLPLPSRFAWESCPILSPARSHSILPTTSSIFSRSTAFPTSMLRTVSQGPGSSVVPNCSHPSRISIPSRPSSTVTTALGLPIASLKTLNSQGTIGVYFRVGEEFYAVTRHGPPCPVP